MLDADDDERRDIARSGGPPRVKQTLFFILDMEREAPLCRMEPCMLVESSVCEWHAVHSRVRALG